MRPFFYFRHVAESLKRSASYSENHREVGIIFASIVNFNELYDESYLVILYENFKENKNILAHFFSFLGWQRVPESIERVDLGF